MYKLKNEGGIKNGFGTADSAEDEKLQRGVYLPRKHWEKLDQEAGDEKSRNEVLRSILRDYFSDEGDLQR